MKKIIIFLLLIIASQVNAQNSKNTRVWKHLMLTKTLNINKAVKIAYKNRPSLKALKYSTQASESNERVAISGYLPHIALSSDERFKTGSKGLQNSTTVQASQLIYSFAGPKQLKKIAKKGTELSKLTERSHEDLIRYEVEASFLQTWLLQEKNKVIKSLNISAKENIQKSEHQDELKLLGKNDWLKDESTYATNMSNVYIYTDELANSQNQLEYLLGDAYKQNGFYPKLVWNSKPPIKIESLTNYYNEALKNRKEIKLKQKEVEQYIESQTYYKNNYLPEVSMTGQASRASQVNSNNIGVNLSWSLFDGASNYYESQKANANKLKALQEKESYVQQIKYEVQKAYHELIQYKKQLTAKDVELRQAENEFDRAKLKFKIGDISKVDLDTSKYNVDNVRFAWLTTKISTTIKQRELFFACGYPKNI